LSQVIAVCHLNTLGVQLNIYSNQVVVVLQEGEFQIIAEDIDEKLECRE
jgi:hypothetical protein